MLKLQHLTLLCSQNPNISSTRSHLVTLYSLQMASPSLVAEYAKSGRSSCKGCGKSIPAGSVRLGLASKDPRGFDVTRWHHLDCFRSQQPSQIAAAKEEIKGFSSLRESDQEALRKLETAQESDQPVKEVRNRDETESAESEYKGSKKAKVGNEDGHGVEEFEEKNPEEKLYSTGAKTGWDLTFSASEVKDVYKDAVLPPKWKAFQTIIFCEREDGVRDSEKIAAFDFDGCLVNTSVRRIGANAWSLMYQSVPEKLQHLYKSGYKLVIFTNESNIERWKNKRQQAVDSKVGRLNNFMKHVEVPIQVFIACGLGKSKDQTDDPFRKPKTGMWRLLEDHLNSGIEINKDQSFYVGDAAGRANDHSDADIKFAQAIGLKFLLPEEYFGA